MERVLDYSFWEDGGLIWTSLLITLRGLTAASLGWVVFEVLDSTEGGIIACAQEAFEHPGSSVADDLVPPPRRQEGKQVMRGVVRMFFVQSFININFFKTTYCHYKHCAPV